MTTAAGDQPDVEVSVIVPVRDGATTIGRQLDALLAQEFDGTWEIVVADNGSTDETAAVVREYAATDGRITLIDAAAVVGTGHARNAGAAVARGAKLAFCDADDVVCPGWLAALADGLEDVDIVAGLSAEVAGAPEAMQARHPARLAPFVGVPGANFGVRRDPYFAVGGMDEAFLRAQDVEFGVRAQRAGLRVALVTDARIQRGPRPTLRGVARQYFHYGYWERSVAARHADALGPIARFSNLRAWGWVAIRVPYLLADRKRRRIVVGRAAKQYGWTRGRRHARGFAPTAATR